MRCSIVNPGFLLLGCALFSAVVCLQPEDEPFQIVRPNPDHSKLELIPAALERLHQFKGPISVIGVVGPYHSGKSFLLNTLTEKTAGFKVGSSTRPETYGVWVLPTNLTATDGSRVLLLDTEGFFGSDASEAYDAKVFAVAALLSSHLVFNSIKLVDQQTVDYLELLARRTQLFQLKHSRLAPDTATSAPLIVPGDEFPELTWVVEDFVQDIGQASPQDWLREYMQRHRDLDQDRSKPKVHGLDQVFSQGLNCHTLFLPATKRSELQDLSKVPLDQLTPEFKEDLVRLKASLLSHLRAKRLQGGAEMDGTRLASLVQFVVWAVDKGDLAFPQLPSQWTMWTAQLAEQSRNDAAKLYDQQMYKLLQSPAPLPEHDFEAAEQREKAAAESFFRALLFDQEALFQPALPKLRNELKSYVEQNAVRVRVLISHVRDTTSNVVVNSLESLPLPLPDSDIAQAVADEAKDAEAFFRKELHVFERSPIYAEYLVNLKRDVSAAGAAVELRNKRLLDELLDAAAKAYSKRYADDMGRLFEAMSPEALTEAHRHAKLVAAVQYTESARTLGKDWITGATAYKAGLALAEKEADKALDVLRQENEIRISAACTAASERASEAFRSQLRDVRPFPDEPDVLVNKFAALKEEAIKQYTEQLLAFKSSTSFLAQRSRLHTALDEAVKSALERNLRIVQVTCDDAFSCAQKQLVDVSYYTPFTFRKAAAAAAAECMAKDPEGRKLSSAFRSKVIDSWIEAELQADLSQLWLKLALTLLAVTIVSAGVLLHFIANRRPAAPRFSAGRGSFGFPPAPQRSSLGFAPRPAITDATFKREREVQMDRVPSGDF
eukprot:TRINITY_DN4181_c0_g1_i1.p2 TRINITY_DN4181_c0_g1~~TRINITY_DN4181_c0_g1_i1.p2  ORF type:complete len:835 (+),score=350.23 TRINITY_DN4181_c0_g1_i1:178-2682(+)